ncbi:molecular chaperone [Trebouxia sp. C0009 RCD-2024]
MDVDRRPSDPYHIRGIRAFEQHKYAEAVRLWSSALHDKEGNAAVILCNRSSAYAQQGCWFNAAIDARQALQCQPDNVTAHYRLAQACFHAGQYKQCLNACQAALEIKPGAKQPRQLHQMAADFIRSNFMTHRNPEIGQAIVAANQAALQQERQSRQQQGLQRQVSEATASAILDRKRAHAIQQESFLRWGTQHGCNGSKMCVELGAADDPYKLLGVERGATEVDLRLAYVRAMKGAHPDKGGSTEQFHRVQAAYHQLKTDKLAGN